MSFIDGFTLPKEGSTLPKIGGGFLNDFNVPTERSTKTYNYNVEAEKAKFEARRLNSLGSIVKETGKDIVKKGEQFVESWATNTWKTYEQTPQLMMQDIDNLVKDFEDINKPNEKYKGNFWGSLIEAGRKTYHIAAPAGRFAQAVFAPISAAIGAALEVTGGQKLIDKSGEVIADKSGITDLVAFQKFAIEHPNAGDAFNNIMNLLTLGTAGESRVNPKAMVNEIKNFTDTIIKPAKIVDNVSQETAVIKNSQERYNEFVQKETQNKVNETEKTIVKDEIPTTNKTQNIDNTDIKVSKQAEDIAKTLEEDFNIKVNDKDLATFKTKENFMLDQATKAQSLIENDPQLGMDIAMGKKNAPDGLNNESVYATMKKIALQAGDTEALISLSKSRVATEASIKGQEIKSLDVLDPNTTDPVKLIQDINKNYELLFEKSTKRKYREVKNETINEIKTEIRKNNPNKKTWEEFINQIKCNY